MGLSGQSSPTKNLNGNKWKGEDGSEVVGRRVHFPSAPVKHLADVRNTANSQRYSSMYEDRRPKIEDMERSEGEKIKPGVLKVQS